LSVGGGLTQRGTERGLTVKRRDPEGNLQEITVKKDDLLQADDIVYVKESWF
jgi:polysaccharide export outer membrane protein